MADRGLEISDPVLRRLYEYWLAKKQGRIAPTRGDIDPGELREMLPNLFLVEAVGSPHRYRYRLVGTTVVKEFGEEITGRFLDQVDFDHVAGRVLAEYDRVAAECRPVLSRWNYEKSAGRHMIYQRLILPLSSDGKTVDMFLCGAVGRGRG